MYFREVASKDLESEHDVKWLFYQILILGGKGYGLSKIYNKKKLILIKYYNVYFS